MPPKVSRRLVVDASIARSAGESSDREAKACRELLACVLSVSHRVVMTSGIVAEWEKHCSVYSNTWLLKMTKLRKIERLDPGENVPLRNRMQEITSNVGILQAMLKDIHLIEAALAADRIVVSRDERVRTYFSNASLAIDELTTILWANPVLKSERVVAWLTLGAKSEQPRLLGYRER
jgi:hypothetical protein